MRVGRVDIGQRSETVRRANLSAIVRGLHERGPLSRSELVAPTGPDPQRDPRAGRRARRRRARRPRSGAVRLGHAGPALPARPAEPERRRRPRASRSSSTRSPPRSSGSAARSSTTSGVERPRGELSVDDVVADLARARRPTLRGPRPTAPIVGIGVAVAGVVRRSDGFVSMAPNLGWRDVPLGARLARALGDGRPDPRRQRRRPGRPRRAPARRGASASTTCCSSRARSASAAALIVDGTPADRRRRLRRRGRPHPGQPGRRRLPLRLGRLLGDRGRRGRAARAGRPSGRRGPRRDRRGPARGRRRAPRPRSPRSTHVGRWLGIGLAGLVNILNPRLVVLGGLFGRLYPFVATPIDGGARPAAPCRRPRALVRVVPAIARASTRRSLGAAELAFEPLLADPAGWFGRATRLPPGERLMAMLPPTIRSTPASPAIGDLA